MVLYSVVEIETCLPATLSIAANVNSNDNNKNWKEVNGRTGIRKRKRECGTWNVGMQHTLCL